MSIAKVLGIETEYGIIATGIESSPVTSSSLLINSYASRFDSTVGWDFDAEKPGVDARGFNLDELFSSDIEMDMVNTVLTNGARYYVDHAHPEVSTPECRTASETVLFDRAGEEIVRQSMVAAKRVLPDGAELVAYKNNSDGKGNSYGCHENYLLSRAVQFGEVAELITSHFVTRQIYCGAGKVGYEIDDRRDLPIGFQISQRADFFEEEIGLETTLKRPIVNTRDEPHCDPVKYRRLHVIVGDSNMSEVATFMKLGTTAILLAMIEDRQLANDLVLATPVTAIRQVSHDPTLKQRILLDSGKTCTALELQESLCERAEKYADQFGLEAVGEEDGKLILRRWRETVEGLKEDPMTMNRTIDWVAKKRIVDGMAQRHNLRPNDPRLKAIDLQYHDMRIDKCLALRANLETLTNQDDVLRATTVPPDSTRAYFRGMCLHRWPADVVAANWDSVIFDVGLDPLRRVPMMEPLRGTRRLTERLFANCATPAELIAALGDQVSGSNFTPMN